MVFREFFHKHSNKTESTVIDNRREIDNNNNVNSCSEEESTGSYQLILGVGNIPWEATASEVHSIFSKWGNCRIEKCWTERILKSFSIDISYEDHKDGIKVLSNSVNLKGQRLQVWISLSGPEQVQELIDEDSPSRSDAAAIRRRRKDIYTQY